jgi:hypothetical protein
MERVSAAVLDDYVLITPGNTGKCKTCFPRNGFSRGLGPP